MNTELFFSSKTDQWATPQTFFDKLNEEFHFTLDPCADELNHKCEKFFTEEQNGLIQSWSGERVFCNPPYGREIRNWVEKCYKEVREGSCPLVVALLPVRTNTQWFHDYVYEKSEIRFIKGKLRFGENKNDAPFPSMVAIYKNNDLRGEPHD